MTFEQKHQKKEAIKIWSHIRNNQHRHEKEKLRKTKKWTKHNTKKIKSGLLRLFRKESGSLSISFRRSCYSYQPRHSKYSYFSNEQPQKHFDFRRCSKHSRRCNFNCDVNDVQHMFHWNKNMTLFQMH